MCYALYIYNNAEHDARFNEVGNFMSIISLPINSTFLFKLSGGCESGGVTEKGAVVSRNSVTGVYRKSAAACTVHPSKGGFTRQSNQMLVTATYSQQMAEVISSTSSFDQFHWGHILHFADENRQLKFHRTQCPNYHFKEQKYVFLSSPHNNTNCLRQNFRTISHFSADFLRQHRMTKK